MIKSAIRKIFEIFKKDLHYKKVDKILHLTVRFLHSRLSLCDFCSKYFEGTFVFGELKIESPVTIVFLIALHNLGPKQSNFDELIICLCLDVRCVQYFNII